MNNNQEECTLSISIIYPDPKNREEFNLKIETQSRYSALTPLEASAALGRAIAILDRKSGGKPGDAIMRAKEEMDDTFTDPHYRINQTITRPSEKRSFADKFRRFFDA